MTALAYACAAAAAGRDPLTDAFTALMLGFVLAGGFAAMLLGRY